MCTLLRLFYLCRHEEEITDTPANPAVLTPDMVSAMFPLVNKKTSQPEEQRCFLFFPNFFLWKGLLDKAQLLALMKPGKHY